jgi:hypothetical protein
MTYLSRRVAHEKAGPAERRRELPANQRTPVARGNYPYLTWSSGLPQHQNLRVPGLPALCEVGRASLARQSFHGLINTSRFIRCAAHVLKAEGKPRVLGLQLKENYVMTYLLSPR